MDSKTRDLLPVYWSRLFPHEAMYDWLNYGDEQLFARREFVFNFGDGDRFLRSQSFDTVEELKTFIKREKPNKIDIGPVYSFPPRSGRGKAGQRAIQKELVLDIDLSDYDQVRNCCTGARFCSKCWKYVTVAIKILDTALREDLHYKHILWVFSGRRGVHAWVCDKQARSLTSAARLSICNYLSFIQGGDYATKKVHLGKKLYPSARRAIEMIDEVFIQLAVIEQNMLGTDDNLDNFLGLLNKELRSPIKKHLSRYPTSLSRWDAFLKIFNKNKETMIIQEWIEWPHLIEEIKMQYVYPRIDSQVTHSLSHLLKAPFSIHPKTGIMGVPIDLDKLDRFDPQYLPRISDLMDQLDLYCKLAKETYSKRIVEPLFKYTLDLQKTVLEDDYKLFCKFVEDLKLERERR